MGRGVVLVVLGVVEGAGDGVGVGRDGVGRVGVAREGDARAGGLVEPDVGRPVAVVVSTKDEGKGVKKEVWHGETVNSGLMKGFV